jgi:hypothetical protein
MRKDKFVKRLHIGVLSNSKQSWNPVTHLDSY